MRSLKKNKFQTGGAVSTECPEATLNPQLAATNGERAIADAEYDATGGTPESACGNCASFDVSQRMKQCMQDGGETVGYCWANQFKCDAAAICNKWKEGGPVTDDQASYNIGARYTEESQPAMPELQTAQYGGTVGLPKAYGGYEGGWSGRDASRNWVDDRQYTPNLHRPGRPQFIPRMAGTSMGPFFNMLTAGADVFGNFARRSREPKPDRRNWMRQNISFAPGVDPADYRSFENDIYEKDELSNLLKQHSYLGTSTGPRGGKNIEFVPRAKPGKIPRGGYSYGDMDNPALAKFLEGFTNPTWTVNGRNTYRPFNYAASVNKGDEGMRRYGGSLPKAQYGTEGPKWPWFSNQISRVERLFGKGDYSPYYEDDGKPVLDDEYRTIYDSIPYDSDSNTSFDDPYPAFSVEDMYNTQTGPIAMTNEQWDEYDMEKPATSMSPIDVNQQIQNFEPVNVESLTPTLPDEVPGPEFTIESDYGEGFFEPGRKRKTVAFENYLRAYEPGMTGKEKRQVKRDAKEDAWGEYPNRFGAAPFNKMNEFFNRKGVKQVTGTLADTTEFAGALAGFLGQGNQNKKYYDWREHGTDTASMFGTEPGGQSGQRGDWDVNSGIFRPADKVAETRWVGYGGETIPYSKPYLRTAQGGGEKSEVVDVDEDTLNELVNAGADIERIPDIDMSQVKQATIKPTPRTLGHKIEDWWKKPQVYNVPELNIETGKWEDKPYYTSFANEWERTGWEPTVTATSAGGLGAGFRGYFPYSDPLGIGLEVDVDPTGPGFGGLLNNYRLKQLGNLLGYDLNLPPGFTYAGAEWAGNALMPFLGVTASMHDTEKLQTWLEHPDNSGLNTSAEVFKHALGPGLWGWNQGPKIGGQFKISNPADVMGKPLWKSPDLFGGKKIPNIISGTGKGWRGRTGIRGGNIIPHLKVGKITPSVRGGFEAMKNDVLALAKEKGITPKAAYSELAGSLNVGKGISKTGIPSLLDYTGQKLYGTTGPGRYNKAGTTVANMLRNMKIPYGKAINHPWFWKGISSALMAPDVANTLSGIFHQPGDPVKDYWRTFSDDQYGLNDPELQSAQQYGPFPRVQRFFDPEVIAEDRFNEAKDKVTWFDASGRPRTEAEDPTTDKFVSKEMKHKQEIGEAYEKTVTKKHGAAPKYDWRTAKTREGVWYDKEGNQVKIPEGAKFEKRKSLSYTDYKKGELPFYSFLLPEWWAEAERSPGEFKKEKYGYEAAYFDDKTKKWVDLWSYDVPALRGAQKKKREASMKRTSELMIEREQEGGEIVDIDEGLLGELINRNADIEIL